MKVIIRLVIVKLTLPLSLSGKLFSFNNFFIVPLTGYYEHFEDGRLQVS